MKNALARLRLMVQMVTDLVFDDDGNASGTGADGEQIDPTVGWHFGFYSRPNDGARGVLLKADGQGNTAFLFAFRDKQYEISLQKGECAIASAFGTKVHLKSSGDVDLVATGSVHLGAETGLTPPVNGVVVASGIDPFTGLTYAVLGNNSSLVMAKK